MQGQLLEVRKQMQFSSQPVSSTMDQKKVLPAGCGPMWTSAYVCTRVYLYTHLGRASTCGYLHAPNVHMNMRVHVYRHAYDEHMHRDVWRCRAVLTTVSAMTPTTAHATAQPCRPTCTAHRKQRRKIPLLFMATQFLATGFLGVAISCLWGVACCASGQQNYSGGSGVMNSSRGGCCYFWVGRAV